MARIASPDGPIGDPATDPRSDDPKSIVNSVLRACALVDLMASTGPEIALSQAADALALSRPTTHRLLNTLVLAGWVRRTESSRYALTARVLGSSVSPALALRELVRPVVRRLAEATGDTVYLFVPHEDRVLCLERWEGSYPVRVHNVNVGDLLPARLGAAPTAMALARSGDYEGHVVSRDNATAGVSAVGAAAFGPDGSVAAGISVTAVDARLAGEHLAEAVTHVRAAAAEISRLLGYAADDDSSSN